MSDDLERTLHESLARHAAQLGRPSGEIDDIYDRVSRRRHRRRAVASVGSLAIAAVGVLGIAMVGGGDGGEGGDPVDGAAAGVPGDGGAWACTGYLAGDGVVSYYADCQVVDDVPVTQVCATVAPPVTAPATWVDPTQPVTVVEECSVPMPVVDSTPPYCVAPATVAGSVPPTTAPMTTAVTTTTISTVPISTIPISTIPVATTAFDCTFPYEQTYTVAAGDSVFAIARLHSIDPEVLANYNSWPEGVDHMILVGDIVRIPPGAPPGVVVDTTAVAGTFAPVATAVATTAP